jgi:hypothetical protein
MQRGSSNLTSGYGGGFSSNVAVIVGPAFLVQHLCSIQQHHQMFLTIRKEKEKPEKDLYIYSVLNPNN